MSGLKTCQCGGAPLLAGNLGQPREFWFVICPRCEAEIDVNTTCPEEAIAAWNTRTHERTDHDD